MALGKGLQYEERARRYLQRQGLRLLQKNYRSRFGEIDLIMTDADAVCFIEVKFRQSADYGGAATAIPQWKRRKLIRTAMVYLAHNQKLGRRPARFDALLIQRDRNGSDHIEWIRNAFYAE